MLGRGHFRRGQGDYLLHRHRDGKMSRAEQMVSVKKEKIPYLPRELCFFERI